MFALAAGRSFYHRLLPDRFLSVGWSSIAVHWLSGVSVPIPDHIYASFARGTAREAMREQSARDWYAFLDHRAHELRRSGRLIVLGGAARDDGTSVAEGLTDAANDALRALVEAGVVRRDEYQTMTIPTWNRTMAEFVAPFSAGDFDGRLQLLRRTLRWLPDPYLETYSRGGSLDEYVDEVAAFFRAAFAQSLWSALGTDRTAAQRHNISTTFARELRSALSADPERAACRWHVAILDIAAV